jgi:hypothetical protein
MTNNISKYRIQWRAFFFDEGDKSLYSEGTADRVNNS